jgi:hypothetical protein
MSENDKRPGIVELLQKMTRVTPEDAYRNLERARKSGNRNSIVEAVRIWLEAVINRSHHD